jgi:cell wall-associated NlpC family hydrolase
MLVGDIVFFKGSDWISDVISKVTHSPYTHVAVVMHDNNILEANAFIKVRIRPIQKDEVFSVFRCNLTDKQRQIIYNAGEKFIGESYDYIQVLQWLYRLTINKNGLGIVNNANRLYCSELVDDVFEAAGIDLLPNRLDGDVTPADLLQSPLLTKIQGVS